MIEEISDYEYLGNGFLKINSNMHQFNVRIDNLYSNIEKFTTLPGLNIFSNRFNEISTILQSFSANWKTASNLVYNLQGYWEEPIQIAFHRTFNYAANFLEVETWLNENFPTSDFSKTQIIRCDYLCKNYSDEMLEGFQLTNYDPIKAEAQATIYGTTSKKVYRFLGIKNQLNAIIFLINALLKKYNNTGFLIDKIKDLTVYSSFVSFNKSLNLFSSEELVNFNNTDLVYFDSYVTQYNNLYKIYASQYIDLEIIPQDALVFFDFRDVTITSGGAFFFKNINNYWTYYPYTNIEFCPKNVCNDCYDDVEVNYVYRDRGYCVSGPKYILTECGEIPYASIGSMSIFYEQQLMDDPIIEQLSDLLS